MERDIGDLKLCIIVLSFLAIIISSTTAKYSDVIWQFANCRIPSIPATICFIGN